MRKILLLVLCIFVAISHLFAQSRVITGRVLDDKGNAIASASVTVKNTTIGTVTGADGTFRLSVPQNAKNLIVSSIGLGQKELALNSSSNYDVTLSGAAKDLAEIVVTGYTRERRSQFAGAATVVGAKAVETVPVASFDQMLQGRVPGLLANSGSGQPGASASVRIRGTSSLAGQGQPLYVIDGVPLAASEMSTINPNDFETITVLKDASASALYGARGGLGVIVITTKSGKAGQTNFTFRTQYGFTKRPQATQFNQLDSKQMLAYEEFVGKYNTGLVAPGWTYSRLNPTYATLPATSPASNPYAASQARYNFLIDSFGNNNLDYYDLLFKTGVTKTNEITMSGGTAASRHFLSIGNFNQEGTDRKSKLNRYTVRFNLDNTIGKLSLRLNTSVGYSKSDYNEGFFYGASGTANPFAMVWRAKPYENPYDANGKLIFGSSSSNSPKALGNLLERSDNSTWTIKQLKANSGLTLTYKLAPQVTLKNTFGVDANLDRYQGAINANSYVGSLQTYNAGLLNESVYNRMQLVNTTAAIYNDKFGDDHEVEIGGYFEAIRQWNEGLGLYVYNLDPRINQSGQGAGPLPTNGASTIAQTAGSAKSGYGIRSFFATGRYTFANKYTVTGSIRRDGTSRILKEENREIKTWSAGLTWDVLKEEFMRNQSVLSNFRLRGSYGKVPNIGSIPGGSFAVNSLFSSVGRYLAQQEPTFSSVSFAGSGLTAVAPSVYNENLRIENVSKSNVGLEAGFWKNRVSVTLDLYKNITNDLFVSQVLPSTSGFGGTSLSLNAGKMENKGIEVDLSVDVVRSGDLDITLRANHAMNKNKILNLGAVSEYVSGTAIVRKGLPVGSHYSYSYLGSDPATGRPIYKRPDGTPTTNINEAGQFAEFGSHIPVHTGGFSATITYNRFTVDAFFSYQFDVRRYNNIQNWVTQGDAVYTGAVTQSQVLLTDQWQKPGDIKMLQSPAYSRQFTSYDISDASFLRFRNLNVSYNVPEIKSGSTRIIKSARFYVQGQNLAIWSPWSGLDPEDDNNISLGEFPNPTAIVVGIDINF